MQRNSATRTTEMDREHVPSEHQHVTKLRGVDDHWRLSRAGGLELQDGLAEVRRRIRRVPGSMKKRRSA